MSCRNAINFQPIPMAALLANIKSLPSMGDKCDSSSENSSASKNSQQLDSNEVEKENRVLGVARTTNDSESYLKTPDAVKKCILRENKEIPVKVVTQNVTQETSRDEFIVIPQDTPHRTGTVPVIKPAQILDTIQEVSRDEFKVMPQETPKQTHSPPVIQISCPLEDEDASRDDFKVIQETPNQTRTQPLSQKKSSLPSRVKKNLMAPPETPTQDCKPTPRGKTYLKASDTQERSSSQISSTNILSSSTSSQQQQFDSAKSGVKVRFKTFSIKGRMFMFLKKLGCGGSSEVFKALELSTSDEYAVKCVTLGSDPETATGYLNEVKVLRQLQKSDRVVKLHEYEFDKQKNTLRLVLEIGETDLAEFLRAHSTGAPPALVLYYWEEMLRAVQQIHQHGIVHADLKPANFLLVAGRLKLIDFGIASAVSGEATSVIRSCGRGTFSYISPEALGGDGSMPYKVSFYSDVWSLGCILYSLIYGSTPFGHLPVSVRLSFVRDPNHTIAYQPAPNVPPRLLSTLKECLRYDCHSRPTVSALLDIPYLTPETKRLPEDLLNKVRPYVTYREQVLLRHARTPEDL